MGNAIEREPAGAVHMAQVGVECPHCHWKQLVSVPLEKPQFNHPMAIEIRRQLEAWMGSRCPDHLNAIPALNKN